jgi:ABC-type transporter Mla subunit MlaD
MRPVDVIRAAQEEVMADLSAMLSKQAQDTTNFVQELQEKVKTATTEFQTILQALTPDILKEINEVLGEHAQKEMVNAIEENMNQVVTESQTTLDTSTEDIKEHLNNFVGNTQKFAADIQDKLDEVSKNAKKEMKVLTDKVKEALDKEVDKFNL